MCKPDVLGEYPYVSHMLVVTHGMFWMPFKGKPKTVVSYLRGPYSVWDTTVHHFDRRPFQVGRSNWLQEERRKKFLFTRLQVNKSRPFLVVYTLLWWRSSVPMWPWKLCCWGSLLMKGKAQITTIKKPGVLFVEKTQNSFWSQVTNHNFMFILKTLLWHGNDLVCKQFSCWLFGFLDTCIQVCGKLCKQCERSDQFSVWGINIFISGHTALQLHLYILNS